MNQRTLFTLFTLLVAFGATGIGCELIAAVDRNLINGSGGAGGAGTSSTSTTGTGGTTSSSGGGGTGGMTTSSTGTGGMCTTQACTAPTDCADPGTECVLRTCDAGCCGTTNVADLTATVGGQTAKNCQQQVCDGNGSTKLAPDDADLPDAADACHVGTCTTGTPGQKPTAAGTTCAFSNGKVCDGNGACVACVMDTDCNAALFEKCVSNTCVAATCNDNTLNGTETDKDCGGGCLPCADGLKCTQGSDCQSKSCSTGICQAATCGDGIKNGDETDVDCGGTCADAPTNKTCGFSQGCADANDCSTASCNSVTCTYKAQGAACGNHGECGAAGTSLCVDGVCCDTSCTNGCMACSATKKGSGGDGICGNVGAASDPNNFCADDGASSCGNDGMCDGAGACRKYAAGTTCRASAGSCDVAEICAGGGAACPSDAFAANTVVCRPSADLCDVAESCTGTSAACPTDGFAANTVVCRMSTGACDVAESCTGTSAACPTDAVALNTVVCRPSAGGCDVAENCDGTTKACPTDAFLPSTTVCRPAVDPTCDVAENCTGSSASCPNDAFASSTQDCGSTCSAGKETLSKCNGSGSCVAGSPTTCTNGCNTGGTLCQTPCTLDGDCSPGNYCSTGSCVPKVGSGAVCGGNNACTSGVCGTSGTGNCCSSACTTTGVCGATSCNAGGACVGPGSGTSCGSSCSGSTLTPSACNGSGGCVAGSPAACPGGLICANATACKATCATDSDCVSSGDYCNAGACAPKVGNGAVCGGNNACTSGICGTSGTGNCCAAACITTGVCGATACNAGGACVGPGSGTSCGSSCSGSTLTPSACNGSGSCTVGTPAACPGSLICANGTSCKATCTIDSDCVSSGDYCNAGACVPKVGNGAACGGDNACTSGICGTSGTGNCCAASCTTTGVCGATSCNAGGACVGPGSGTSCGSSCSGSTLTPSACNGSGSCTAGTPVACPGGLICANATSCKATCTIDTDCVSSGDYCNAGTCTPKGSNGAACGGDNACTSGICGTSGTGNCCAAACIITGVCGATSCNAGGACVGPGSGTSCGSSCSGSTLTPSACNGSGSCTAGTPAACAGGLVCASATACKTACASDVDCASAGDYCMNPGASGVCVPKAGSGAACTASNECASGVCDVDGNGNCCAAACNTANPTCGATACDGAGACGYPTSGTACGSSCTGSTLTPSTCDGSGSCGAATPAACAGGLVCADATSCKTTCASDTDCASASDHCNGSGACVADFANGTACTGNNQCSSGICGAAGSGNCCATACAAGCDNTGACLPPDVVSTTPADGAVGVAPKSTIAVTFNQAMNPATLTGQTGFGPCTGSIQVSANDFQDCIAFTVAAPTMSGGNTIATLTPFPGLPAGTVYHIRVTTAATSATSIPLVAQFTQPTGFTTVSGANACDGNVVISQVYGGGGSATGTFKQDYVELHNRGTTAVNLANTSVQYASAGGTTWAVATLSGTIQPGAYYLVQMSTGAGLADIPTPNATAASQIPMAAGAGKVAFVSGTTALTGGCPFVGVLDLVGYGATATCFEGTGSAPAPSATLADFRGELGCADTNNNASNFTTATPAPRNGASPLASCTCNAVANELGTAAEADFCVLQFPASFSVQTGQTTSLVYGRVFETGTTSIAGQQLNVIAQFGYGPNGSDPTTSTAWNWYFPSFNVQVGNDDEYQAQITAPAPGTYAYTYRFTFDGLQWTYCDTDGAGSNAGKDFSSALLGTMSVTP